MRGVVLLECANYGPAPPTSALRISVRITSPLASVIACRTVRPKWLRYGKLLEVVDGNWMLPGSRQDHEVLEETRPLYARHARHFGRRNEP
jgi:hypothetical protein